MGSEMCIRDRSDISGKNLFLAALEFTIINMLCLHQHLYRCFIMCYMCPCAQVQVFSLRCFICHLTGVGYRCHPRKTVCRISVMRSRLKRNPVIDHLLLIVCREELWHPLMSILFKLCAPLHVKSRHLFTLSNLIRYYILHFLVRQIIPVVFWISDIPEISI